MTLELISRDEARALGLTRFFTGKPCINRHIAEQYTASGNCTQCCIERSRCEHRLPLTPLQQEQIRLQKERDTQAHERRLANIKLATARAEARLEAEKTKQAAKIERQRLVFEKEHANRRSTRRRQKADKGGYAPPPDERDCPPRPADGLCQCCKRKPDHARFGDTLVLDHDHQTGEFRDGFVILAIEQSDYSTISRAGCGWASNTLSRFTATSRSRGKREFR